MSLRMWCLVIVAVWLPALLYAQDLHLQSGDQQTVMIELYTSEGCSSCPPAERYLNGYLKHPRLWEQFIPLAFHVDYWDYLGWQDRYSDPAYSARQRRYARDGKLSTIYTPALVVNGQGWRPRSMKDYEPSLTLPSTGKLTLTLSDKSGKARFHASKNYTDNLQLHVALLGMGLTTEIASGENRGHLARHEFVVLSHSTYAPSRRSGERWQWNFPGSDLKREAGADYALVAWVSVKDDPTPVQALGGHLPRAILP